MKLKLREIIILFVIMPSGLVVQLLELFKIISTGFSPFPWVLVTVGIGYILLLLSIFLEE